MRLNKSVNRNRCLFASRNRINRKFRACVNIAACKNVWLGSLVSHAVSNNAVSASKLDFCSSKHVAPNDALSNRKEHIFTLNGDCVVFIISRIKSASSVFYRNAFFEHDSFDFSVLSKNFFWPPAAVDFDSFFFGFVDFFHSCRHFFALLQAKLLDISSAASPCSTANINRNISATNNDSFSAHFVIVIISNSAKEINRSHNALGILARNSGFSTALTANRNVESFVSLLTELLNRNIFSNFNASFNLNAHFFHDIDFSLNDIFFEFETWNSVNKHTASNLVFLENSRAIAFFGKVERTRKTSRTATDNRNLLLKFATV